MSATALLAASLAAPSLAAPSLAAAPAPPADLAAAMPGLAAAISPSISTQLAQLTVLVALLALAPSLLVMTTAFTRILIVLALLRSAIGAQGTPPNAVLIGLALFLTYFVMQPVLDATWQHALLPMSQGRIGIEAGLAEAVKPLRGFMLAHVRGSDLALFQQMAKLPPPAAPDQAPLRTLIPAFMTGELRRAFEMGFYLYLPFMVIDLVVASVLMALGMVMLPPNAISLPLKLIFFVGVDGWQLTLGGLAKSFLGQ